MWNLFTESILVSFRANTTLRIRLTEEQTTEWLIGSTATLEANVTTF